MNYSFTPRRLMQSKEDIAIQHPLKRELSLIVPDDALFRLITRLVSLEKNQVKKNALALSLEDIQKVTIYLPFNYYSVNMSNLFEVFRYRSTIDLCQLLYNQWQDSYDNNDCNAFLKEMAERDENFIMILHKNNLSEAVSTELFGSDNIPLFFAILIKDTMNISLALEVKVKHWGIRDDSRLFKQIQFLFYTFCNRADYLMIPQSTLIDIVKKYGVTDLRILKLFLINYLQEFKLSELEECRELARYLETQTGKNRTDEFNKFFADVDASIVEKYVNWLNILLINDVFGYDERSLFWKQYKFLHIDRYWKSDSIVMEMKNYYVTEFLGKAMGPIYFYEKDVFNTKVRRWFLIYDNTELRSKLFNHQELCDGRETHMKPNGDEHYWCRKVHGILISKRMTEKIVD
ncbi:MAG: hypothetical protein K6G88_05855 [Lachnospiraceae bacterium]|nr:hypothetical protein [Lachnospiraceae bacterium]